jgi:hypothetical protein
MTCGSDSTARAALGRGGLFFRFARFDVGREHRHVGAGAERAIARAGHHDHARVVVGVGAEHRVGDLGAHRRRVRVHPGGTIERDCRDFVRHLIEHRFVSHR